MNNLREKITQRIIDRFYLSVKDNLKETAIAAANDIVVLELQQVIEDARLYNAKYQEVEKQLVEIAGYIGKDARDVIGENKTIAGLVKETIEQHKEDAERYRNFGNDIKEAIAYAEAEHFMAEDFKELMLKAEQKASQYDKMFEGLVVEEKCPDMGVRELAFSTCIKCNGTGTFSRPLKEEEKVEAMQVIVKRLFDIEDIVALGEWNVSENTVLSSGARVVRK